MVSFDSDTAAPNKCPGTWASGQMSIDKISISLLVHFSKMVKCKWRVSSLSVNLSANISYICEESSLIAAYNSSSLMTFGCPVCKASFNDSSPTINFLNHLWVIWMLTHPSPKSWHSVSARCLAFVPSLTHTAYKHELFQFGVLLFMSIFQLLWDNL